MLNGKYGVGKTSNSFSIQDEENLQIFPLIAKPSTTLKLSNKLNNSNKNNFFLSNLKFFNQTTQNNMPEVSSVKETDQFPVPPVRRRLPTIPMMDASLLTNNSSSSNNSDNGNDSTFDEFSGNFQKLSFANFDKKVFFYNNYKLL